MILDIQLYMPLVARLDLTEAEKEHMIRTVWGIMESYVDQAFGVHPVQLCREQKAKNDLRKPLRQIESKKPKQSLKNKPRTTHQRLSKRKASSCRQHKK